jgi:UDP-GlcNAc:undecaprenyl-phosphate/decaprenyl-phosphate GlcNAc-1-phosphate transferase
MTGAPWEYAAVFVASLFLALLLTPLMLRLAVRWRVLDRPGDHKGHALPVPYLGGLAIVSAFSAAVLIAALVRPPSAGLHQLEAILGTALILSVVGLIDDLRGLGASPRIVVEVGAAVGVWIAGARVDLTGSKPVDLVLTVVWVTGITNAFNLLDNMDGLSAGVAAIAAGSFLAMAAVNGQFLVGGLAAALAGCALGFLRHNFHPARIYMGDAGSLYLGFLLAYLALKLRFDLPQDLGVLVPIVALGLPILDTTLVTISRLRHRRSPFQGGRDHISHRLVRIGLSVRAAVGTIYLVAVGLGALGLLMSQVSQALALILAGIVLAMGIVALTLLARISVYDDDDDRRQSTQVSR